jgi:hypothetical protein
MELTKMNKKFISSLIIISLMMTLLITACNSPDTTDESGGSAQAAAVGDTGSASATDDIELASSVSSLIMYLTFEDAAKMATGIVVAQYVERRPFGQNLTEFEFIVHERIFGNAADRIFVYVRNNATFSVVGADFSGMENYRPFTTEGRYLLLLTKIANVFANTHEDGFLFLTDLMLDLNNPGEGTMYGDPVALHAERINFNSRNLTSDMVTSYLGELTQNNTPAREYIRSDNLQDILEGSPYVLIVEITEPRRLLRELRSTDWASTDIYFVNVIEVLKGDMEVGSVLRVVFFADTVFPGERHIVSIESREPDSPEPYFHGLTSRHSLHSMGQLDEIVALLAGS